MTDEELLTPNKDSKQLIEKEEVPNTPFILVTIENKSFLAFGNYKLCQDQNSKKEVLQYLKKHQWDVITKLMMIVTELQLTPTNHSETTLKNS